MRLSKSLADNLLLRRLFSLRWKPLMFRHVPTESSSSYSNTLPSTSASKILGNPQRIGPPPLFFFSAVPPLRLPGVAPPLFSSAASVLLFGTMAAITRESIGQLLFNSQSLHLVPHSLSLATQFAFFRFFRPCIVSHVKLTLVRGLL